MRNDTNPTLQVVAKNAAPDRVSSIQSLPIDKNEVAHRWLYIVALFMASLNLRPVVSSIAPVLANIQHDLGLSGNDILV